MSPRFPRQDLELTFAEMDRVLQVALANKRKRDLVAATSFTVFRFFQTDENLLSDILKFLLDPRETHGQQALFLNLFAKRLNREIGSSVTNITAAREAITYSISKYRRRIDVLVTTPTLVIALENKVDAEEQDEQLSDYYEHLRRICKKDYCLVFLTPDGRSPERMPDKTTKRLRDLGRLFLLSYCRDIDEWLMDCHRSCEAKNVRSFIANMRDYIESRMQTDRR